MSFDDRDELRLFLFKHLICGCGEPEEALKTTRAVLTAIGRKEGLSAHIPVTGHRMLILAAFDRAGLTEHGGTIEFGWLTEKGEALRAALEREAVDNYESLLESA